VAINTNRRIRLGETRAESYFFGFSATTASMASSRDKTKDVFFSRLSSGIICAGLHINSTTSKQLHTLGDGLYFDRLRGDRTECSALDPLFMICKSADRVGAFAEAEIPCERKV
jgi:hypothetical protein